MINKSDYLYIKLPIALIAMASLVAILGINTSSAQESVTYATQSEIVDGDLVQVSGDIDVYIIKIVGEKRFKRLILNPTIFDSYDHLEWRNIKTISQDTLDIYKTSNTVQEANEDGSIADVRLFQLFPDGDKGTKRYINITSEQFIQAGGDIDAIYYINSVEAGDDFYSTGYPIDDIDEFKMILQALENDNPNPSLGRGGSTNSRTRTRSSVTQSQTQSPTQSGSVASLGTATGLTLGVKTNIGMNITWSAVTGSTDYELQHKLEGASDSTYSTKGVIVVSRKTKALVSGLEPGTRYTFRVRSTKWNPNGQPLDVGLWSTEQTYSTDSRMLAKTHSVSIDSEKEAESNQVHIRWTNVSNSESYEIQHKLASAPYSAYVWKNVVMTGETKASVTKLQPNTTYTIRVRAMKFGTSREEPYRAGVWSDEITLTTSR